jgi:hypothetical protein
MSATIWLSRRCVRGIHPCDALADMTWRMLFGFFKIICAHLRLHLQDLVRATHEVVLLLQSAGFKTSDSKVNNAALSSNIA